MHLLCRKEAARRAVDQVKGKAVVFSGQKG